MLEMNPPPRCERPNKLFVSFQIAFVIDYSIRQQFTNKDQVQFKAILFSLQKKSRRKEKKRSTNKKKKKGSKNILHRMKRDRKNCYHICCFSFIFSSHIQLPPPPTGVVLFYHSPASPPT